VAAPPQAGARTAADPRAAAGSPKKRVKEGDKKEPVLERISGLFSQKGAGGKQGRGAKAEIERLISGARKTGDRVVLHGAPGGGGGLAGVLRELHRESK
jgi:hypothetical protein